jgi:hypothetical protein
LFKLEEGELPPEKASCPECGSLSDRVLSFGSNMKVAVPDGTKRFAQIKAQRVVEREEKKAAKRGDKETLKRLKVERTKLGG